MKGLIERIFIYGIRVGLNVTTSMSLEERLASILAYVIEIISRYFVHRRISFVGRQPTVDEQCPPMLDARLTERRASVENVRETSRNALCHLVEAKQC